MKDNNGYQYIVVTNDKKPRLIYTRKYEPSKGKYYGPFASSTFRAFDIYNLLLNLFPLRPCRGVKGRPCFYYGMDMCVRACVNEDTPERYEELKLNIDNFFKNGAADILEKLAEKEKAAAERLDFESAKRWLELRQAASRFSERQIVALGTGNIDVLGFSVTDNYLTAVIFSYTNGKLINKNAVTIAFVDSVEESLESYLYSYYSQNIKPNKLFASLSPASAALLQANLNIEIICPERGKMHEVLELAAKNARNEGALAVASQSIKYKRTIGANEELAKILRLQQLSHIELFDNSNIFNVDRVAAMVVYINGEPNKKAYRKYKIKLVNKKSDFDYMHEIIYRRYFRLLREQQALPDLILVDGGKPQITAAQQALQALRLTNKIIVAGLVKDEYHRTDGLMLASGEKIILNRSESLYFYLANMQEEVHRFAISFFRQTNRKSQFSSLLETIPGIGKRRINRLLAAFGSVSKMRTATESELAQVIPTQIAKTLKAKLGEDVND